MFKWTITTAVALAAILAAAALVPVTATAENGPGVTPREAQKMIRPSPPSPPPVAVAIKRPAVGGYQYARPKR
jgi:hypothetical protein